MNNLPNDIIMRIIREADGGLYTHKKKFLSSIEAINEVGYDYDTPMCDRLYRCPFSDEFFNDLCENNTLSIASFIARARTEDMRGWRLGEEEIKMMVADMRAEGLH